MWLLVYLLIFLPFGSILILWLFPCWLEGGVSVASTLSEACLVSYQDARCSLHSIGHSLYESPPDVSYSFSSLFFFSHFLFSLFVLFLHVQFCKANSRYCISQLVSLQRKFTVSCSLLRYSVNGFIIYISIFINLPISPSPDAFTAPLVFSKNHSHHCGKPPDQRTVEGLEGVQHCHIMLVIWSWATL